MYLRDIEEGLPAFREAWNAWVDPNSLPVSCQTLQQRCAVQGLQG